MAVVHFVTNRNPEQGNPPTKYGKSFHPMGADYLRFGWATVIGKKVTVKTAPEKMEVSPGENQLLGSASVFQELHDAMLAGRDTIVYIHGYNVDFNEAARAAARVQRVYKGGKANVVMFTWPSDGSLLPLLAYKSDRSDARASAVGFARGVRKLIDLMKAIRRDPDQLCHASIHLMCHSMGCYVLRNGLQEVRKWGGLPRVFDQIFLFAADEDYDTFEHEHKLALLPELGQAVNVYFNTGDLALFTSDHTKGNPARLGSRGPRLPLQVPGTVTLVDASRIVGGTVEHSYYLDDKRVIRDVNLVLRGSGPDIPATRKYVASGNKYVLKK
jgi:esterase/lipase superfamily enzyme